MNENQAHKLQKKKCCPASSSHNNFQNYVIWVHIRGMEKMQNKIRKIVSQ